MLNSNTTRPGSRYTDLPRPSTPVSATTRLSPLYLSRTTRPSGDVLQGGSAFGLSTPVWRQGADAEWRSSRNRINPNPALSAPSTPRSGSMNHSFPLTNSLAASTTKINVELPPRKGDLFRRAGESNELPSPQPTPRTPRAAASISGPPGRHMASPRPEHARHTVSLPSSPSRTTPLPSPVQDSPRRLSERPAETSLLSPSAPAALPAAPLAVSEASARTPLPERGRASSSPQDVSALVPLPLTPERRRAADNGYQEPTVEERRQRSYTPRTTTPVTPRPAASTPNRTTPTRSSKPATATTPTSTATRTAKPATAATVTAPVVSSPPPPTRSPITNERTASMSHSASSETRRYLIPPQREQDVGKLVVVLDLDETLVYSREGGIFQRPGVKNLLDVLKGRCELIVWTAGVRDYALEAIQVIDTSCAVQHCIYRHPMWFTNDVACPKDLRLLGRPLDTVIIVDNTPDVFRLNPDNAILVTDFLGKASCNRGQPDRTLTTLAAIFDHVLVHFPAPTASHILASKRLMRRSINIDDGASLSLSTLKHDRLEDLQREPLPTPSLVARFAMLRYMNRGSHLNLS